MIYIDKPKERMKGSRLILCAHMTADSLQELHDFALSIGLVRRLFQKPKKHPHYDLWGFPLEVVKIKAERGDGVAIVSHKELVSFSHLLINKTQNCHGNSKKISS